MAVFIVNAGGGGEGGGVSTWDELSGKPQNLVDIGALTDPGADSLVFWDDSAGAYKTLTLGTNLSITSTTINASGAGGVSDGDKGDITVSASGATWTLDIKPSGAIVGTTDSQTLTNKTLTAPVISTISNTGTVTLPTSTDTLVGRATTDTLTNKTLTAPTMTAPVLGTPASGTLTNCTGLPIAGLTSSTATALGVGSIELGSATDTSITRVSAGVVAIEGVNIVTVSGTQTLSNKTLTTPILGTPASGTLTSCTGLPLTTGVTGTLPVANGGTGLASLGTALQILRVNAGATALEYATSSGASVAAADITDAGTVGILLVQAETESDALDALGITIDGDAAASDVNTGTSTDLAITPDAFAGSNFGIRFVELLAGADYTTDAATGDGQAYFVIPTAFNGMNLVYAKGKCVTAGTTGTSTVQVRNVTQTADMLTTKITFATTAVNSGTVTAEVIDTANDDVATNDLIAIDVDSLHTTKPKGVIITLGFALP